ncbi:hypothetical protein BH23CHL1_BH23CHL1_25480 [soil metagenome]
MADQSVVSAANFLLMIVSARALGPSTCGVFALVYTLLLFAQSFQDPLVTSPLSVIGVTKTGGDYRRYTSAVAVIQAALACALGILLGIAGLAALPFDHDTGSMLLAMAIAAVAWQCHEFSRRVLYAESSFKAVLINDTVTYGTRLALLGLLVMSAGVTGERLFLLLGATWSGGAIAGLWQIRGSLTRELDREVVRQVMREHWHYGRWLLGSELISHMPRYVTAAVMSTAVSVGAYGAYRAFVQLVNGANVPLQALNNILRPQLARDARRGTRAVWHTMLPVMLVGGAGLAAVATGLIIVKDPLLGFMFGSEFVPYTSAMFLLTLTPLLNLQKQVLSNALQAFHLTRAIFLSAVVSALAGASLGAAALEVFGLPAAGAIALIGASTSVIWLGTTWARYVRSAPQRSCDPQPVTGMPVIR